LRNRFRKKQEMNHLQEVLQQEQRYDDFENVTSDDATRPPIQIGMSNIKFGQFLL
jgi:hypothetical protein